MRKMRETKKERKERIDDMMMREFFGILGLGFPFYSISFAYSNHWKEEREKRREEKSEA